MGITKIFKLLRVNTLYPRLRRNLSRLTSCTLAAFCILILAVFLCILYFYKTKLISKSSLLQKFKVLKDAPHIKGTPMSHIPLNQIDIKLSVNLTDATTSNSILDEYGLAYQVYTPGCQIPLFDLKFKENDDDKTAHTDQGTCGKRAVFLRKSLYDSNYVTVSIYKSLLNMSSNAESYSCSYRYIKRYIKGKKHKIRYTPWIKMEDAKVINLESDFINVKCTEINAYNMSTVIYQDFYPFTKKNTKERTIRSAEHEMYNVLMLGIDSMSLSHFAQSLRRSFDFTKQNYWLSYPGFHTSADHKLQSIITTLTGTNFMTFNQTCFGKMDSCNDKFIWSNFKNAGYVTAYGEDYLKMGETFNGQLQFLHQPTDHYMKYLFHKHEHEHDDGFVCTGKVQSGEQLLDYAFDFANTYRNEKFFGFFWLNSFNNIINSVPSKADRILENFLNNLYYTGVLKNTFFILFSSHGVHFGDLRLQVEGYYEERLPLLLVWSPWKFRTTRLKEMKNAALNQLSLITHYDLYNTLVGVLNWSHNKTSIDYSEVCQNCVSIFQHIQRTRTCEDAVIEPKWCSCHNLYPLDIQDSEGIKSVFFAVAHINSIVERAKTKKCWKCARLTLKKVLRIHFYYINEVLYYVVAFSMAPANIVYEAKLSKSGKNLDMVGGVKYISPYWGNGSCTMQRTDRLYCVCQALNHCLNTSL